MCRIILPIKPEYVERIIEGKKTYEYRKIQCKRDVESILIYSTSPVKRIVGEVEVLEVLKGSPERMWEETCMSSGISEKNFFNYYENAKEAVAYKLGRVTRFDEPKELSEYGLKYTPQSFVYV